MAHEGQGSAGTNDAVDAATAAMGHDAAQLEAEAERDAAVSSGPSSSTVGVQDAFEPPANASFETARPVMVGADTRQRVVNDKQVDYYRFEARAGSFYVLWTDVSDFSPDNILTVFDPMRTKIAENDRGSRYATDHVDARIVLRAERSGTYYVTAEDRTATGSDAQGHFIPPALYRLSLREITTTTEGYALAAGDQASATVMLLQDASTPTRYVTLLGALGDDGLTDTFEIRGMADNALIGRLLAAGTHGDGSTAASVSVRVTAESDGHLLATCGLASGQMNIHPPVDEATYRIEISADKPVGSNGFYAVDLVLLADNPHERAEMDNDSPGAAEPIAFSVASSRRGLLLSRLPAKDIDYYSFTGEAGELAAVRCEGESGGSGVRGLQAEVLTPMMVSLVTGRETRADPLTIEPFKLEASGTYYLKLSSETPAASTDDAEPWARCAVVIGH